MEVNEKGHIICPCCIRPTKIKVRHDTELKNFPLFCTWCKQETIINHEPEPRASAVT